MVQFSFDWPFSSKVGFSVVTVTLHPPPPTVPPPHPLSSLTLKCFFNAARLNVYYSHSGGDIEVLMSFHHHHNIQGSSRKFLEHYERHFRSQVSPESSKQSYQANNAKICNKKWVYHVCLFGVLVRHWRLITKLLVSEWHRARLPRQNNRSCTADSPFTDCNQTHFCLKCWLHLLNVNQFGWFEFIIFVTQNGVRTEVPLRRRLLE